MLEIDALSAQFNAYLQSLNEAELNEVQTASGVDLHTLLVELSGLRTEVKSESRLFKTSMDEFKAVFDTLQNSQMQLQKELDRRNEQFLSQKQVLVKPMLLAWLEQRDAVANALHALAALRPTGWTAVFRKGRDRLLQGLIEGQRITLKRLDDQLSQYQVYPLMTQGQPLDPHTMRAVEIGHDPQQPNGIVIAELRAGFTWENALLRIAEVKVNKHEKITS